MRLRSYLPLLAAMLVLALLFTARVDPAHAKPAPSPTPSPTTPPTPYMPPEQVTNGIWDIILQGKDISYSTMKLKDDGNAVTGFWLEDKRTVYVLSGTRDGTHIKLDIKRQDKPDVVIGSVDAEIDGIADMVGTITLGATETPFQGAQHARVPPPVEASPTAQPTETPF